MMCYLGMTFCSSDCVNKDCNRHFGDKEKADSKRWWGGDGAPIAFGDYSKDCEKYEVDHDS